MMRYRLDYWQRLGDIIQLFPAAKHLRDQGHEVFLECRPQYHDIFATVDYVRPSWYDQRKYDRILSLGIHPSGGGSKERYQAYRQSGLKWHQFVYDSEPDIAGYHGAPVFTNRNLCRPAEYKVNLGRPFYLVAPFGHSQITRYNPKMLWHFCSRLWKANPVILGGSLGSPGIMALKLSHLPDIISWATDFASINSAPAIIASGVRKDYIHFPQTGAGTQDDTAIPGISRVTIPKGSLID